MRQSKPTNALYEAQCEQFPPQARSFFVQTVASVSVRVFRNWSCMQLVRIIRSVV